MSCNLVFTLEMFFSFTSLFFPEFCHFLFSLPIFLSLVPVVWLYLSLNFVLLSLVCLHSCNYFIMLFLFKLELGHYFLLPCGNIFLSFFFICRKVFLYTVCPQFHHTEVGFIPSYNSYWKS